MKWTELRDGFYLAENVFPLDEARKHLIAILRDGEDPLRGFHHPDLKPNRFHQKPKYPVKCYMGYGHYWNPMDYRYHATLANGATPFLIPPWMQELARQVVSECFPHHLSTWQAQAALVNYYTGDAKMGMHVDKDEADHRAPVIGISFGGTCRFLFEDQAVLIPGNSVYCFGDSARLMRHGVGTTYKNSLSPEASGLLKDKERLSVTLRKIV